MQTAKWHRLKAFAARECLKAWGWRTADDLGNVLRIALAGVVVLLLGLWHWAARLTNAPDPDTIATILVVWIAAELLPGRHCAKTAIPKLMTFVGILGWHVYFD